MPDRAAADRVLAAQHQGLQPQGQHRLWWPGPRRPTTGSGRQRESPPRPDRAKARFLQDSRSSWGQLRFQPTVTSRIGRWPEAGGRDGTSGCRHRTDTNSPTWQRPDRGGPPMNTAPFRFKEVAVNQVRVELALSRASPGLKQVMATSLDSSACLPQHVSSEAPSRSAGTASKGAALPAAGSRSRSPSATTTARAASAAGNGAVAAAKVQAHSRLGTSAPSRRGGSAVAEPLRASQPRHRFQRCAPSRKPRRSLLGGEDGRRA